MLQKPICRRSCLLLLPAVLLLAAGGCVGPMACGPFACGTACCDGPLSWGKTACGDPCNGCGELYIDEWINHPPKCCDPCDTCGNYTGQSCHACRPIMRGFPSLWGYRCEPPPAGCDRVEGRVGCGFEGGCDSGCASCSGGAVMPYSPAPGRMIPPSRPQPELLPGPEDDEEHEVMFQGQTAVRKAQTVRGPGRPDYQQQRAQRIFRPRAPVVGSNPRHPNF